MHFLVIAFDGTDNGAPARRATARPAHLAGAGDLTARGHLLYATSILDDDDQMIGSMLVVDFPSRDDIDRWLAVEPYVTGDVWRHTAIERCSRRGSLLPDNEPHQVQFLVVARDGTDRDAVSRRMAVREGHLASCDALANEGHVLYTAAILDENGTMSGSMLVLDFPSREDVDSWLDDEPYRRGDVWRAVDVHRCRVAPSIIGRSRLRDRDPLAAGPAPEG